MVPLWLVALVVLGELCTGGLARLRAVDAKAFDKRRQVPAPFVVAFCVPWYDPCKNLQTELQTAADGLSLWNIDVLQVDCDADAALCSTLGIKSYPAIRLYEAGVSTRYREAFRAASLIRHVLSRTVGPIARANKKNVHVLKSLDVPLMLLVKDRESDPEDTVWSAFASAVEDFSGIFFFASTDHADVAAETGRPLPFVKVFSSLNEVTPVLSGDELQTHSLQHFSETSKSALVGKPDINMLTGYMKAGIPLALIFSDNPSSRQKIANDILDVVWKYKGKVNFATVDAAKHGFLMDPMGLQPGVFPAFAVQTSENTVSLNQNEPITVEAVEGLLQSALGSQPTHSEL